MSYRLVIDGNSVYEIDEDFERYRDCLLYTSDAADE